MAEFIDAVLRIKRYDFDICTHVILNLPGDTILDTIETANIICLKTDQVKIHSLYIMEDTEMGRAYKNNEIKSYQRMNMWKE